MNKEDVTHTQTHTHTHTHTHTILPCAATWMDLMGIILSDTRQRKTNTMWYHFYVEYTKIHQTIGYDGKEAYSQI